MQARCGIEARKVGGRRITSEEDLTLVKQVICGQVSVDLVSLLQSYGINAFGCHGASGKIILAEKRPPRIIAGASSNPIDFGEVGDVVSINKSLLLSLVEQELVPVVASLGVSEQGRIFNINADTTVVQITKALAADLLIFVTGIGGIFRDIKDPNSRFPELDPSSVRQYINEGLITDGMIPKVEEALKLSQSGVGTIAITDTRR